VHYAFQQCTGHLVFCTSLIDVQQAEGQIWNDAIALMSNFIVTILFGVCLVLWLF